MKFIKSDILLSHLTPTFPTKSHKPPNLRRFPPSPKSPTSKEYDSRATFIYSVSNRIHRKFKPVTNRVVAYMIFLQTELMLIFYHISHGHASSRSTQAGMGSSRPHVDVPRINLRVALPHSTPASHVTTEQLFASGRT